MVQPVATQLGHGVEPVRLRVKRAEVDVCRTHGMSTAKAQRIRELEQENGKLRRANEVLERAESFFGRNVATIESHSRKFSVLGAPRTFNASIGVSRVGRLAR